MSRTTALLSRRHPSSCLEPGSTLLLRIPRELKSPNQSLWQHWRAKSREKQAWLAAVVNAIVFSFGYQRAQAMLTSKSGLLGARGGLVCACPRTPKGKLRGPCACPADMKRVVTFRRLVPGRRNFIRDDDNLAFATKHVVDCLRDVGLIRDDSREWCARPLPVQDVSDDGHFWTEIRISSEVSRG